jgi:NAD(P)-dependent dehydrogenase (short-subunit alcohol dehydrogenase family)/uncharacterized OB-fold protein
MAVGRPKRKNPVLRTRQATLPPAGRSRVALGMLRGPARGGLELQSCADCGAVQYPPREMCGACLSDHLVWRPHDGAGELLVETTLRHAMELHFRERLPWRSGLVRLDGGPTVVAHVHADVPPAPARVTLTAALDRSGQAVLVAVPPGAPPDLAADPRLAEMTCDPKGRKALVTDAKSETGQAMVRALVDAGAEIVWAGVAAPWITMPGFDAVAALPQVTVVPLDVTDGRSVDTLAAEIGHKVDLIVNTADHHRTHGLFGERGVETAAQEMEVNYTGLLRLARAFGPVMRARAMDGPKGAAAWVNLLSVFALSGWPAQATWAASKAAAHALTLTMRAELQPAGVRVVGVYPGPVDEPWNQQVLPPKLSPAALASAVVAALRGTVEEVYPGDVAQDWLARLRSDPKALEREMGR